MPARQDTVRGANRVQIPALRAGHLPRGLDGATKDGCEEQRDKKQLGA
jgi:hypothetical protein